MGRTRHISKFVQPGLIATACLSSALMLGGCGLFNKPSATSDGSADTVAQVVEEVFSSSNGSNAYKAAIKSAQAIDLNAKNSAADKAYYFSDDGLHIAKAGAYLLTGSLSEQGIWVDTSDACDLIFEGVTISNTKASCIKATGPLRVYTQGAKTTLSSKNAGDPTLLCRDNLMIEGVNGNNDGGLTIDGSGYSAIDAINLQVNNESLEVVQAECVLRVDKNLELNNAVLEARESKKGIVANSTIICSNATVDLQVEQFGISTQSLELNNTTANIAGAHLGIHAQNKLSANNALVTVDAEKPYEVGGSSLNNSLFQPALN